MQNGKGIRERSGKFEWNLSYKGKRYTGTADTFEEAVTARKNQFKAAQKGAAAAEKREVKAKSGPTLKDVFNLTCLSRWAGTKSESTARRNAMTALTFFGEDMQVSKVTANKIAEYLEYMRTHGIVRDCLSTATINRKMSALSTMMLTAMDHNFITAMPKFPRLREYKGRERFVSEEEEQKILHILDDAKKEAFKAAFITLIDTGIRTGEFMRLEVRDIDFTGGKYGIIKMWETKSDKPRAVPLTRRAAAALANIIQGGLDENDIVFPQATPCWMRENWAAIKKKMGLEDDKLFVPHILRHTCASRLVQRGVPILEVQRWLGHADVKTTMRYSHLAPNSLFNFVDVLEKSA